MKMHSDLGKMYRRNYMVKSQLRSLEDKSRALNSKIDGETKIDEWAESYITRADAQIDDVSDYMQYRNLGGLAKRVATGHVRHPAPQTRALPAPSLPHYGQQRQPAPSNDEDGDGVPDSEDDDFGNLGLSTMDLPLVSVGNTIGSTLGLGAMAAVLGLVTYNEYRSKKNMRSLIVPRLKQAAIYGAGGVGVALLYQSFVGTGQKTGWY